MCEWFQPGDKAIDGMHCGCADFGAISRASSKRCDADASLSFRASTAQHEPVVCGHLERGGCGIGKQLEPDVDHEHQAERVRIDQDGIRSAELLLPRNSPSGNQCDRLGRLKLLWDEIERQYESLLRLPDRNDCKRGGDIQLQCVVIVAGLRTVFTSSTSFVHSFSEFSSERCGG